MLNWMVYTEVFYTSGLMDFFTTEAHASNRSALRWVEEKLNSASKQRKYQNFQVNVQCDHETDHFLRTMPHSIFLKHIIRRFFLAEPKATNLEKLLCAKNHKHVMKISDFRDLNLDKLLISYSTKCIWYNVNCWFKFDEPRRCMLRRKKKCDTICCYHKPDNLKRRTIPKSILKHDFRTFFPAGYNATNHVKKTQQKLCLIHF